VKRDFTASAPNVKWVGDMTEIPTDEGKLYLATMIDLYSRRLLGYPTSAHPDAELAGQAIKMAVATRGSEVAGVIFHSDRGSTPRFNRSSQHSIVEWGVCCGTRKGAGGDCGRPAAVVVSRAAADQPA
jgi:transposase InsO family protein